MWLVSFDHFKRNKFSCLALQPSFSRIFKMTTNTSMIDISAIAFQRNFVHNNTKELSQKVNISYFWLISFRQKIIWFWISWKLYVWLRVRYMITTKLSPPNSLIMLCWVSLLTVSLFVTIVSNSLKGERKKCKNQKWT